MRWGASTMRRAAVASWIGMPRRARPAGLPRYVQRHRLPADEAFLKLD